MIDYIIVRRRDLQDLHSVQTMSGADCWTDHRLVRVSLALKIRPKTRHTTLIRPKQFDKSKLQPPETKSIFIDAIDSIELDKENTWEDSKTKVLSVAHDTLGVRKRKYQNWFAKNCEEINALLEMKNHLFLNTLPLNLSCHTKEEAIKKYKEFQSVVQ